MTALYLLEPDSPGAAWAPFAGVRPIAELRAGLEESRAQTLATVLTIETDPSVGVPGYESWWDVPPAEVSEMDKVKAARRAYEEAVKKERWFL